MMTQGSQYLGKLYNDLIANSPQTISMDIPSDMGKGRIAQTKIKHGVILSDWFRLANVLSSRYECARHCQ